ncbi:flavin-containing monooxygenase [Dactylosporangium sp. CA-233914]|uniref:flavin-containing monooxygenase n=1 Tax=Dactylosporangium sp. CA-233914 TaxID=3239934 RepID=UPI003D8D46C9
MTSPDHVDVLIIGAGLAGIGAACRLRRALPAKTIAILEARDAIGGTWDLFRYPGVRSDSDMFTLGYRFRPWRGATAIADGGSILRYVRDTAREYGVDESVRFNHRVLRAEWSSADSRWSVVAHRVDTGETVRMTCGFLFSCAGYYRYDAGHAPQFPGIEDFRGRVVHPQHWPEDLDYAGKRVVVIGSGATAITLAPALAGSAAHVTMLQRSPTYVVSLPSEEKLLPRLRRVLPERVAYAIVRWKNVLAQSASYQLSRRRPELVKQRLRKKLAEQLPPGYDIGTHFTPRYNPWDQRMCVAPDGDLFAAIGRGAVSVVTGEIETFTADGVRLASGADVPADVVVTATGLRLLPFGGARLYVDGREVDFPRTVAYKGMMLTDVPNFAFMAGYTNASYTLKVELVSQYVCRLLAYMGKRGYVHCAPQSDASVGTGPLLDFAAGYVRRTIHEFPRQGDRHPYRMPANYLVDAVTLRRGRLDEAMRFGTGTPVPAAASPR